jgi:hypothetical protein
VIHFSGHGEFVDHKLYLLPYQHRTIAAPESANGYLSIVSWRQSRQSRGHAVQAFAQKW